MKPNTQPKRDRDRQRLVALAISVANFAINLVRLGVELARHYN